MTIFHCLLRQLSVIVLELPGQFWIIWINVAMTRRRNCKGPRHSGHVGSFMEGKDWLPQVSKSFQNILTRSFFPGATIVF